MRPWSTVAAHDPVARARPARRADARPLHAVRRLGARRSRRPCSAASRTCRPARASGIPAAAPAPCPCALTEAGARAGRRAPHGHRRARDRPRRRRRCRRRRSPTTASASPLAAVVSNADACGPIASCSPAPTPRARFERRRGYEPACSGVVLYLGLDRALRPPAAPQFRLLARPARGVRRDLPPGRARARPDLLRLRPGRDRARASPRRAARPSTCWSTRPISARATTGTAMLPGLPPRRSSTSSTRTAGLDDLEDRIRVRELADARRTSTTVTAC